MNDEFDITDIQGNILRGYRMGQVRHLVLEVTDRRKARAFLAAALSGDSDTAPQITRESSEKWSEKPDLCFNIGITHAGLRALGVPAADLQSFPTEFREGMTKRAQKLKDFGDSAPIKWAPPFDTPDRVHLVASTYANDTAHLDRVQAQVGQAFGVLAARDGRNLAEDKVFFGYRDSISQPRFEHVLNPLRDDDREPENPLGTILLGHHTRYEGIRYRVPSPAKLGRNGAFNAFRVLKQDVVAFEDYLTRAATYLMGHPRVDDLLPQGAEKTVFGGLDRHAALREVVAAQMCGRWRNGTPYETSPYSTDPETPAPGHLTNFDYTERSLCPAGAHTRRANPRNGPIVQRMAHYSRRIVRRGMSYGPDFDPANPENDKDAERGLLGNFLCANLGAQFEAVMCDWINLGLQDPDITGANDPILGANVPETSWFDLALKDGGTIRLRGFPRFITTRGGAYTFLPSMTALDHLSKLQS